ncbi:ASCH domain-containing protein [Bacillus sp. KH172YL63]|uniref:ASCH domain-containing protein n=1 Tax=Bacillus sp. KH172YL63 TaxID=2709784 RepID=UPI0015647517|nr:ASCH domain-containing protein [Bacillus sp. KH172YL63]
MWKDFLTKQQLSLETPYESWHFCIEKQDADELASLVQKGKKTATSSLHILYDAENEPLPEVGEYHIITDYDGDPKAIIQTEKVTIVPFRDVGEDFARKEGEGDLSLSYWRKIHIDFFMKELTAINRSFTEDMLVVCEEFKVVHT